jgi:hypothetical protein
LYLFLGISQKLQISAGRGLGFAQESGHSGEACGLLRCRTGFPSEIGEYFENSNRNERFSKLRALGLEKFGGQDETSGLGGKSPILLPFFRFMVVS